MKDFLKYIIVPLFFCTGVFSCAEKTDSDKDNGYSIAFAENPVIVGYDGGRYSVSVISECSWSAESDESWISDISAGNDGVEFVVSGNTSEDSRDGEITFHVSESSYAKVLTVRQLGNSGALSVDRSEVTITTAGNEEEIRVNSSENWTVSSVSADWLMAVKKNSSTLTVSAGTNFTGSVQEAEVVIVTSSGKEEVTVSVTQEADNSIFLGAETDAGRRFAYASGLVTNVTSDKSYRLHDDVGVLEIQYMGKETGSVEPYSLFVFDVELGGDAGIAVLCAADDDSSIKPTESEETRTQIVREQMAAMQSNRPDITVLGGTNGDFFYGGVGSSGTAARNNLLHGIMYRKGKCLKDTFDGGSACTVFAVMKDGTARIITQSQYPSLKGDIYEAIGGRQHIMSSGEMVQSTDTRLEPRTAVGVSRDGKRVFIAVVDGRRDSYSVGATYTMLFKIMSAMGAYDAINLDGGGSSTFAVREGADPEFVTHNRPTDSAGDREVVNGLAVILK